MQRLFLVTALAATLTFISWSGLSQATQTIDGQTATDLQQQIITNTQALRDHERRLTELELARNTGEVSSNSQDQKIAVLQDIVMRLESAIQWGFGLIFVTMLGILVDIVFRFVPRRSH